MSWWGRGVCQAPTLFVVIVVVAGGQQTMATFESEGAGREVQWASEWVSDRDGTQKSGRSLRFLTVTVTAQSWAELAKTKNKTKQNKGVRVHPRK